MQQEVINALLWPVRDVPKIFEIGTTGAAAALPALVEVGIVGAMILFRPLKIGSSDTAIEIENIALAYAAASAASFVLNKL